MFFKPQHVHFTGIGGIGMSGLAEVLLTLGYKVTGSDARMSPITSRLEQLGAKVFEGHRGENLAGAKALVVTSAVGQVNAHLNRWETVKVFRILPREFSVEGGELTPSLKIKRASVVKHFADVIEEIYAPDKGA